MNPSRLLSAALVLATAATHTPVALAAESCFRVNQCSIQSLASQFQLDNFVGNLGLHREASTRTLDTATTLRIYKQDPQALSDLEHAAQLAVQAKRHAEILQLQLAMAVQTCQYIVDIIDHKHDWSILWNDIAAFFGIFTYIGGLDGLLAALGKFVFKEIAFHVQPKTNALDAKEWQLERQVMVNINQVVDGYYSRIEDIFTRGTRQELFVLQKAFNDGDVNVNTEEFQLDFRRKLVRHLLRDRYTPEECVSSTCVGHPVQDPETGVLHTFKSDLKTRQVQYMEEIGISWWNVYHGLDGWQPKVRGETYKCVQMIPGVRKIGVHCGGHWRDLLPIMRQITYKGKVVGEKTLTRGKTRKGRDTTQGRESTRQGRDDTMDDGEGLDVTLEN